MADAPTTGPETDTNDVDETDDSGVAAPESNEWWKFENKDDAVKWGNDQIQKRLSRHKKSVVDPIERERDTLKAEVERLKPLEDATKTDIQRRDDQLSQVLPELDALRQFKAEAEHSKLVRSIATELNLPERFIPRIQGNDEDAIREDISDLLNVLSEGGSDTKKVPVTKAPKESGKTGDKQSFSSGGGGSDEESDDSLVAEILGQVKNDRAKGGLTTRR